MLFQENVTPRIMKRTIKDEFGIGALYTAILALPERAPKEYAELMAFLNKHKPEDRIDSAPSAKKLFRILYKRLLDAYHAKALIYRFEAHNVSPTVGRTAVAMRLANDTTYTGVVTRVAIGSGTNAPAAGNTTLQTETYRKAFDDTNFINNIAYLSAFIPAGTATGTHNEAGLFIDGTDTVDTGQIISRVLFSPPISKTALTSLTIEATLTVS